MPQPGGEGGRIETDRAADPETRYSIFGSEFVNLAYGDIQQFGNIGDGEGVRPPIERVREINSQVLHISAPERAVWQEMICPGFGACPPKRRAAASAGERCDKIFSVTSHRAMLFVGGLWAVLPGITAIRGKARTECAICETCKTSIQSGFTLCG